MLSDLHFDPFRDPAKVPKLAAAPVAEWAKILAAPESPDRAASYAALEAACKAKGEDSDYSLIDASLKAEKAVVPDPKFVAISGDLLVHQFDCRYRVAMKTPEGYAVFAGKTASFVIRSVEATFPKSPVYVGAGNNDSACGDYKMDLNDRYFAGTGDAIMAGLLSPNAEAKTDYAAGGYYAAMLPGMKTPTHLLMLDDIFLSKGYTTCAGKVDQAGATAMMTWLSKQLNDARTRGEKVWVMGHIPPGVNVYSTIKKGNLCTGKSAESFLSPVDKESLGDVIAKSSDVVTLALFGHTHMDEIRLIETEGATTGGVPMKGIASVSPVDGNRPSFTVAKIDPATSTMTDYSVYVAPSNEGIGPWKIEYSFDAAYAQKSFSATALRSLVDGFHVDANAGTPASQAYMRFFDPMFPISPLVFGWPQYGCGIDHLSESGYKACACPAAAAK